MEEQLDALVQKTMGALRGTLSSCTMPGQNVLLKGMLDPSHEESRVEGVKKIGERYFALKKALEKHKDEKCLKALPFNSGYFMSFWCECNAEELRNLLLEKFQTGIIRSDEHHIRLAFSSVDLEKIEGLVDTVYKAASELV